MKTTLSLIVATIFSFSAFATDENHKKATDKGQKTGRHDISTGADVTPVFQEQQEVTASNIPATKTGEWFVGASFGHARMKNDEGTFIMGLQGGWIFNHRFILGAAGYGFMNGSNSHDNNMYSGIRGGYGGLLIAPVFWGARTVHLSFPMVIGGGGSSLGSDDNTHNSVKTGYFIFAPGAEVEVSITKNFRIAGAFIYRITSNNNWNNMDPGFDSPESNYINGPSINLIFRFGDFHTRK